MFWHLDINPVVFYLGQWPIRWYGISYIVGFVCALWHLRLLNRRFGFMAPQVEQVIALSVLWAAVVGGRLGHFVFYVPFEQWSIQSVLRTWEGGMSFHGGLIAASCMLVAQALKHRLSLYRLSDVTSVVVCWGIGFGRIANFINQELIGLPTDGTWGVVFTHVDNVPRHPSALYESVSEGFLLGLLLHMILTRFYKRQGLTTAVFLIGYGVARFICEYWRSFEGWFLTDVWTLGQGLSMLMISGGVYILWQIFVYKPSVPLIRQ